MVPVTEVGRKSIRKPRRRHTSAWWLLLVVIAAAVAAQAQAAQQSSARWTEIQSAILGDTPVADGDRLIALDTPSRAQDAAVVPVEIATKFDQTPQRHIRKLFLIIDNNPSPVAAIFEFPGDRNWKTISTRIRVNAYTDVRVVAELNDGKTYMVSNFVKASGGCSAPALKDPAAAMAQLGRMKLIVPDDNVDDLLLAKLMVRHPNSSGLQFDQITRNYIPADYIRSIEVTYKDEPLFKVATDISISENPMIAFGFAADSSDGSIDVQVKDSEGREFEQSFPVVPTN
ncbi:quinoprotein dehydrogenase-associated SoxYZ-like carrier [Thiosocius teredinicola]|uniref:quinoprotein dehydrogenase-associated SoxYZ-like carrier n=1 Tax=Thiosocius teredinicola TaxID=1973002 RepID=UPI00099133EA